MRIFEGVKELLKTHPQGLKGAAITLGNFDGVHRGHQMLLQNLTREAVRVQGPSVVMTFQPHPLKILAPEKDIFRLFSLEDQAAQLEQAGIQYLIRQPFDQALAQTSAANFLQQYLLEPLNPKVFVVGHDFHFGQNRKGHVAFLKSLSKAKGFEVLQVPAFEIKNQIVSSSRVRQLLAIPDLPAVHELLGRNYSTVGQITTGDGRGEKLGIPTANLIAPSGWPLPKGVYITSVTIHGQKYSSITNVGLNPTFEDPKRPLQVESFIFDLNKNIYGETIKVEFFQFLRPEKKFQDAKELIAQIQIDIQQAKEFWHGKS